MLRSKNLVIVHIWSSGNSVNSSFEIHLPISHCLHGYPQPRLSSFSYSSSWEMGSPASTLAPLCIVLSKAANISQVRSYLYSRHFLRVDVNIYAVAHKAPGALGFCSLSVLLLCWAHFILNAGLLAVTWMSEHSCLLLFPLGMFFPHIICLLSLPPWNVCSDLIHSSSDHPT